MLFCDFMTFHLSDGLPLPMPAAGDFRGEPGALGTWHAALSDLVSTEVPHDLLAVWFYPSTGGSSLVGPAALAADDLQVPLPSPRIGRPQLELLEEIILDAGYGSAACFAARNEREDVGLILAATFQPDVYDRVGRERLREIARRIAPTLATLANPERPEREPAAEARLLDGLADVMRRAQTPRGFARGLSDVLDRLVPHDRLDILIPGASRDQCYRLSAHEEGALWSDMTLVVPDDLFDPAAVLAGSATAAVDDAMVASGWRGWAESERQVVLRSALGCRLVVGERTVGYLLAGASDVGIFDTHDAELLARIAPAAAARVESLVQGHQLRVLRTQLGSAHAVPNQLRRMATSLATCADVSAALRECVGEATALLPFHRVRFALATADPGRVVVLVPGDQRAPGDLASVPVVQGSLAQVLTGEVPHAVMGGGVEVELIFPLRVTGRVTGVMIYTTATPDAFTRAHLVLAQQVADLAAPWIELHRRGAPPSLPIGHGGAKFPA